VQLVFLIAFLPKLERSSVGKLQGLSEIASCKVQLVFLLVGFNEIKYKNKKEKLK